MTEQEWLACTYPETMLAFLHRKGSNRKLRLFAVACCRDIWNLIRSETSRKAVEASEAYADGRIRRKELMELRGQARQQQSDLAQWASMAVSRPDLAVAWVAQLAADATDRPGITTGYSPTYRSSPQQCGHLRDLFGPLPFRRVSFDPAILHWSSGTVVNLAHAIYEDRRFADLPILADALEDAGCTDVAILDHLRGPGPHVRGCWVLDLLLDRK